MLEILTAAESTALVELATLKAHLRPAVSGTGQDANLTRLIGWASAAIATWCRRTFARQEYRQTLPGSGTQRLMLGPGPVECDADRLLPSLSVNGSEVTDYRLEDPYAAVLWRRSGWPQAMGSKGRFGSRPDPSALDRETVVAEFWAGYVLPGEDPPEDVTSYALPADVERAALVTVVDWYRADARDGAVTSTSASESEGEGTRTVSASFAAPDASAALRPLPSGALALLKDYRR